MIDFKNWIEKQESSAFTRRRTAAALGLAPPIPDASVHSRSTCPPGELDLIKKAKKKKKKKSKKKNEHTFNYYRCPFCEGDNVLNGVPGTPFRFKGSAKCYECDATFSAMFMKPLGEVSIEQRPDPNIDKWLNSVDNLKRDLDNLPSDEDEEDLDFDDEDEDDEFNDLDDLDLDDLDLDDDLDDLEFNNEDEDDDFPGDEEEDIGEPDIRKPVRPNVDDGGMDFGIRRLPRDQVEKLLNGE